MYFVITVLEKDKKIRVRPLANQRFPSGEELSPSKNVSCDKQIRAQYPVGTVFACRELMNKRDFYLVKDLIIYPVNIPGQSLPDGVTPVEMLVAYNDFMGGGGSASRVEEMPEEAPRKKSIPTYFERLKAKKSISPPTIEEDGFYIDEDSWYLLIRNASKNINTLILGPTGSGKTEIINYVAIKMGVEISYYDMGALHDPMTGLLGSHRIKDGHSVFDYAKFTQDIQKPVIIVLDELSRAPLSTNNILFPCLDSRRSLPVEIADSEGDRSIPVHEDACFFSTANIGGEYTGTNVIDRALLDRFFPVELDYLPKDKEALVLRKRTGVDNHSASVIAEYANTIRGMYRKGDLSVAVSPRHTMEVAGLVKDGMALLKACQFVFLPIYDGTDTIGERSTVKTVFTSR